MREGGSERERERGKIVVWLTMTRNAETPPNCSPINFQLINLKLWRLVGPIGCIVSWPRNILCRKSCSNLIKKKLHNWRNWCSLNFSQFRIVLKTNMHWSCSPLCVFTGIKSFVWHASELSNVNCRNKKTKSELFLMFGVCCISVQRSVFSFFVRSFGTRQKKELFFSWNGALDRALWTKLNTFFGFVFHLIGASHRKQFSWKNLEKEKKRNISSRIKSKIENVNYLILWMRADDLKTTFSISIFVLTRFIPIFFPLCGFFFFFDSK